MNDLFDGKTLCLDTPADCFWMEVLYEAAGIEPTFTGQPIESFVVKEAAGEILRKLPVHKGHRALQDVQALQLAMESYSNESSS